MITLASPRKLIFARTPDFLTYPRISSVVEETCSKKFTLLFLTRIYLFFFFFILGPLSEKVEVDVCATRDHHRRWTLPQKKDEWPMNGKSSEKEFVV